MAKYLIDLNLPFRFAVWNNLDCVHLKTISERWTDEEVWEYAKQQQLTVVTKDSDFSHRVLVSKPPPKVIHVRFGNLRFSDFHQRISKCWDDVCRLSETHKLVIVFRDTIEGIE